MFPGQRSGRGKGAVPRGVDPGRWCVLRDQHRFTTINRLQKHRFQLLPPPPAPTHAVHTLSTSLLGFDTGGNSSSSESTSGAGSSESGAVYATIGKALLAHHNAVFGCAPWWGDWDRRKKREEPEDDR